YQLSVDASNRKGNVEDPHGPEDIEIRTQHEVRRSMDAGKAGALRTGMALRRDDRIPHPRL
ncbi:hypothetical protein ACI3PL_16925, partial [Lacticaseibacillus paracasei]